MTVERNLMTAQPDITQQALYANNITTIQRVYLSGLTSNFYTITGGGQISGYDIDSSGNMYIADLVNDLTIKVTPAGAVTNPFARLANSATPRGLICDDTNSCFYTSNGNGNISRVTYAGTRTLAFASTSVNQSNIMALDSSRNIYIGNGSTIIKVTPAGSVTLVWATVTATVVSLNVDSSNNVWAVYNNGAGTSGLAKVTSAGTVTSPFYSLGGASAFHVFVDTDDQLYVTCEGTSSGCKVVKFTAGGGTVTDPWFSTTFPGGEQVIRDAQGFWYMNRYNFGNFPNQIPGGITRFYPASGVAFNISTAIANRSYLRIR